MTWRSKLSSPPPPVGGVPQCPSTQLRGSKLGPNHHSRRQSISKTWSGHVGHSILEPVELRLGQTARLRLTRDRFIAGHCSCELRRYLDSVPLETPIRDVVDRCRVWESHADPDIRWVSKPGVELIYPACVVGDSDKGGGGGGFAARISSKIRPQNPGGGATWITGLCIYR